jgi:hypothetical protein
MDTNQKNNKEKTKLQKECYDYYHNPLWLMYIPPGDKYEHTCPSCGHKTILVGPKIKL